MSFDLTPINGNAQKARRIKALLQEGKRWEEVAAEMGIKPADAIVVVASQGKLPNDPAIERLTQIVDQVITQGKSNIQAGKALGISANVVGGAITRHVRHHEMNREEKPRFGKAVQPTLPRNRQPGRPRGGHALPAGHDISWGALVSTPSAESPEDFPKEKTHLGR